jgi:hypothetical protein
MSLLDDKCARPNCWHYKFALHSYCYCCVGKPCRDFTARERMEYNRLIDDVAARAPRPKSGGS